jgi:hypothetical protein
MRILYQWATIPPSDWQEIDSADWASLPARGLPVLEVGSNSTLGWINAINVQGVSFESDHYAVEDIPDGAKVTVWNDDLTDRSETEFYAAEWTFLTLAPDEMVGGLYNTRQSQVVYIGSGLSIESSPDRTVKPWAEFVPPDSSLVRHGIWMSDTDFVLTVASRTPKGWREWTEGVPQENIVDGRVTG